MRKFQSVSVLWAVLALCAVMSGCGLLHGASETGGEIKNLDGITVIVDAGHGDTDVGTIGVSTGRYEKEVNLEVSKKLQAALEARGVRVVMTRESDEPLGPADEQDIERRKEADMQKREEIIGGANAHLLISIHQNRFEDQAVRGPQVFYLRNASDGAEYGVQFSECLQTAINEDLQIEKPRNINYGNWRLLKKGDQPGAIVECGFFSNPEEEVLLQQGEYQDRLVAAIVRGTQDYVEAYGV
ncbi:MAG TPA: N-acetylmuramoyl-L-alanine amidase [Clostridiales bacterium]|nr:N-acetylmuramoyl-L-alanine amidase [Clostridiales bacterium]